MDLMIGHLDPYIFDPLYSYFTDIQQFPSDYWVRQWLSNFLLWWIGGFIMYFSMAALNYVVIFDRAIRKDVRFLPNQEWLEIQVAAISIPLMAIPSSMIALAEMRGYSRLHEEFPTGMYGLFSIAFQIIFYLAFTDSLIYWIHRWLHHPLLYGPIHKLHHKWKVSTPFASHAFHPIDGFSQSIPYHIYVFLFPLNKYLYLALFIFVNFWTISIHDGSGWFMGGILNGANHHTIHHRQYNYNYGQYFTFWDRICNTHRLPKEEYLKLNFKES